MTKKSQVYEIQFWLKKYRKCTCAFHLNFKVQTGNINGLAPLSRDINVV